MSSKDYNRRSDGKFGPGNDGGPGRPKREIEAEYLDATVAAVSVEDWAKVVQAMLKFATAGNVQAATWLANYIVGRPTEHIAVSSEEPTSYKLILPRGANSDDLPSLPSGEDEI